jgi:hypothetical protein
MSFDFNGFRTASGQIFRLIAKFIAAKSCRRFYLADFRKDILCSTLSDQNVYFQTAARDESLPLLRRLEHSSLQRLFYDSTL